MKREEKASLNQHSIPFLSLSTMESHSRSMTWTEDGTSMLREDWVTNGGQYHRVDGPAIQQWKVVKGQQFLIREDWYLQGNRHRVDGPASRMWTIENGERLLYWEAYWEAWYLKREFHRVDGPAFRSRTMVNGEWLPDETKWYLEGKVVSPFASPFVRELVTQHLRKCGLVIWPGLMELIGEYLV